MALDHDTEMDALLFVDTNILLDFYRIKEPDVTDKFLEQLEACMDRLITGSQVEMEYKKNRQKVIMEVLDHLSEPDCGKLSTPALLSNNPPLKAIEKKTKEIGSEYKKVHEKIGKILGNPIQNDPVYQALQRIFKNRSPYNLDREASIRFKIRTLARKRFTLGYPPRKESETSIGDAINWEWVIRCSYDSDKDIVIVTRDSDFGAEYNGSAYVNDWLREEFKQRVGGKRQLLLTHKLSVGLQTLHAVVTKEMQDAENKLLEDSAHRH